MAGKEATADRSEKAETETPRRMGRGFGFWNNRNQIPKLREIPSLKLQAGASWYGTRFFSISQFTRASQTLGKRPDEGRSPLDLTWAGKSARGLAHSKTPPRLSSGPCACEWSVIGCGFCFPQDPDSHSYFAPDGVGRWLENAKSYGESTSSLIVIALFSGPPRSNLWIKC